MKLTPFRPNIWLKGVKYCFALSYKLNLYSVGDRPVFLLKVDVK